MRRSTKTSCKRVPPRGASPRSRLKLSRRKVLYDFLIEGTYEYVRTDSDDGCQWFRCIEDEHTMRGLTFGNQFKGPLKRGMTGVLHYRGGRGFGRTKFIPNKGGTK